MLVEVVGQDPDGLQRVLGIYVAIGHHHITETHFAVGHLLALVVEVEFMVLNTYTDDRTALGGEDHHGTADGDAGLAVIEEGRSGGNAFHCLQVHVAHHLGGDVGYAVADEVGNLLPRHQGIHTVVLDVGTYVAH